ncbi:uncharacterized protein LOC135688686 [Rhopilema esculentum]|uniref:uncharacterized protein LOC135688686 n=1 Tax=Rhopilema esculentum TaxID=499914 RepID=UPI0031CF39CC
MQKICELILSSSHAGKPMTSKTCKRKRKPRRFWVRRGRTQVWWNNFKENVMVKEEWRENFRMSRETFTELCDELRPYIQKQRTHLRESNDVETQVAMTLYYMSDKGRYRKVANSFGVARSTVSMVIRRVTKAISQHLGSKYIKLPVTQAEVEHHTKKFLKNHGFPQCIGAVDGTHIEINQPNDNYTDFLNRKGRYSFNVQAVCNYQYLFIDVVIQWPGSVHDARVFGNSSISHCLRSGKIPTQEKEIVPDSKKVPVCLIGDAAYPILPFLMKEFPSGAKTVHEQFFSYRLSSARMTIECAFGRLKGRFSALRRPLDIKLESVPYFIHACFILHNICELKNEPIPESLVQRSKEVDKNAQPPFTTHRNNNSAVETDGKKIRDIFVKYFD